MVGVGIPEAPSHHHETWDKKCMCPRAGLHAPWPERSAFQACLQAASFCPFGERGRERKCATTGAGRGMLWVCLSLPSPAKKGVRKAPSEPNPWAVWLPTYQGHRIAPESPLRSTPPKMFSVNTHKNGCSPPPGLALSCLFLGVHAQELLAETRHT